MLRYADPAVTGPALDAARAVRAAQPRPVAPQLRAGELVARYENGDHCGVWRDLGAVGRLDGPWRAETERMAVLTMERVRRNALNLTAALIARGWPVSLEKALPGPAPDVEVRLRQLEQATGSAAPPTLAAYWRIVGTIDLVPRGTWDALFPPDVPEQLTVADPLEVIDLTAAWFSVEEWQEQSTELHPEIVGPLKMMIAADYLRRAFTGNGFLRLDRREEWLARGVTRDSLAELDSWLESVEYEHTDFRPRPGHALSEVRDSTIVSVAQVTAWRG